MSLQDISHFWTRSSTDVSLQEQILCFDVSQDGECMDWEKLCLYLVSLSRFLTRSSTGVVTVSMFCRTGRMYACIQICCRTRSTVFVTGKRSTFWCVGLGEIVPVLGVATSFQD